MGYFSLLDLTSMANSVGTYADGFGSSVAKIVGVIIIIWGVVQLIKVFTDTQKRGSHAVWALISFGVGLFVVSASTTISDKSGNIGKIGGGVSETITKATGTTGTTAK